VIVVLCIHSDEILDEGATPPTRRTGWRAWAGWAVRAADSAAWEADSPADRGASRDRTPPGLRRKAGSHLRGGRGCPKPADGPATPATEKGVAVAAPEPAAASPPRRSFVETAYWNPSVVTDKDGKARVVLKAPTALAEYRITARGVTGADTLLGQATADVAVRKDLSSSCGSPPVLNQGGQTPIRRPGPPRGRRGAGERPAGGLFRGAGGGVSEGGRPQGGRRRRGGLRPDRGPRRRPRPPDARRGRRGSGR
jgi:hypothetical protein